MTVERVWSGGRSRQTDREQGGALLRGEYKQSCAAWVPVDGDADKEGDFCASCTNGIVAATCGATWGCM